MTRLRTNARITTCRRFLHSRMRPGESPQCSRSVTTPLDWEYALESDVTTTRADSD